MENSKTVTACFRALLGRAPSEQEATTCGRQLADGVSLEKFLESILTSVEFASSPRATAEFVPAGHFYSVIPSLEVRTELAQTWPRMRERTELPGLALDLPTMAAHFERIQTEAVNYPFPEHRAKPWRYYFRNPAYAYADGISLYAMMRHVRPRRIVEVGSGFSSALMLDTNEREFGNQIDLTFIEPYPELLFSFFRAEDHARAVVIPTSVQKVDVSVFAALETGDVLFVDSTHVAKLGSDVNHLYLEVLPRLKPGVVVHIHDIFWPFEYPPHWVQEGRAWNEAYLLRALLQQTKQWEILYFSDYFNLTREAWIQENAPLIAENGGGHIWLRVREG